jgi:hypothetical protein
VPKALTLPGLVAVFAAGLVLAVTLPLGGGAADTTTTTTTTTTESAATTATTTHETSAAETTTTLPATTITVETTTTRVVPVGPAATTTSPESTSTEENGTAAWIWVLLGILAAGLIALIVLFATRGHGGGGISPEDRLRRLDAAVASWAAQGWAVETHSADSAVLRRGAESMLVAVDPGGHVATRPLEGAPPPSGDWPGGPGDPQ